MMDDAEKTKLTAERQEARDKIAAKKAKEAADIAKFERRQVCAIITSSCLLSTARFLASTRRSSDAVLRTGCTLCTGSGQVDQLDSAA